MKIYLVRHARAKSQLEDPQRSLSDEGWAEIRKVAGFLSKYTTVKPDRIYHSGKIRAKLTAEVLSQHLKPKNDITQTLGLSPEDNPLEWVRQANAISEDIMLVGHLPHLEKLASMLLGQDSEKRVIEFTTGGIACLENYEKGKWVAKWVLTPDILP